MCLVSSLLDSTTKINSIVIEKTTFAYCVSQFGMLLYCIYNITGFAVPLHHHGI